MDNKDFKFLCVNTKSLWLALQETPGDDTPALDIGDRGIALKKDEIYTYKKTYRPMEGLVDFALDQCGIIYGLDRDARIVCLDPHTGYKEYIEHLKLTNPKLIAIDSSNIYVVHGEESATTDAENGRAMVEIMTIARVNHQIRRETVIDGITIEDVRDIAVDSRENLYLLSEHKVHRFNALGKPPGCDGGWSVLADDLQKPASIAVDDSDALYVLETSQTKLRTFSIEHGETPGFVLQPPHALARSGLAVINKTAYIGVGADQGRERDLYEFDISREKETYPGHRAGYSGRFDTIRTDSAGNIHILDREADEIALLELTERLVSTKATYVSKPLDSNETGCHWHKFVLERTIPSNTHIAVSYLISDSEDSGSTQYCEVLTNPQDALILSPKGRYIRFKLELSSADGLHTPTVNSLKVFFPRKSYLRYLPELYQNDPSSRDFLERFLSLFETFFWELEENTEGISRYFDVDGTPEEFIRWLSSWLGISTDENWSIPKKRELLRKAPELFRKRGTRAGLRELIEIFLDEPDFFRSLQETIQTLKGRTSKESLDDLECLCRDAGDPIIVEQFQLTTLRKSVSGEVWERLFGNCPYRFCVLLNPFTIRHQSQLNTVRRIVEQEKPAHTRGGVVQLQPWLYLDMHTYLGINTVLSEPRFVLEKDSVMSRDTVLADREESGQIDVRARAGMDTVLT